MKTLVNKYPIGSFLILNYLISWSFLYPSYQLILSNDGITPLALIGLIGAYGPTIAAVIIQVMIDKSTVRDLLKKVITFKVGWQPYLWVILFPILIYVIVYAASLAYQGETIEFHLVAGLSSIPIWFLLALPFGPMGEELGWRGFMLPKLLEKYSPLMSSVLVGLAWGIWHLASFTFPGAALPEYFDVNLGTIGLYCLNTVALSFFYTYIHLRSRGSVFLAILLHAFFNAASSIAVAFLIDSDNINTQTIAYIANMILTGALGILLLRNTKKNR